MISALGDGKRDTADREEKGWVIGTESNGQVSCMTAPLRGMPWDGLADEGL